MKEKIYFTAIASGSNGNCYYVGNDHDAVLIDAGISRKQVVRRMENLGLDIANVRAIIVTHEHGDHVRGIPVLSKIYKIPVYITVKTLESLAFDIEPDLVRIIEQDGTTAVGELLITSFSKQHDASEPLSVSVSYRGKTISILTDIGFPCENVVHSVINSDVIFLETNYDEQLLEELSLIHI